jgi:hypothetical protein
VSCLVDTLFEEEPALATVPDRFFLELLREQAEGRRQLDEKFARTLEVAHAAGIAIPLLAEAAGLTASRIHARLQKQRTLPPDLHLLADDEVKEVLEHAFDVAIVAAGRVGYPEYRRYGAYICQAGRAFRNDPRYFAFYANSEVKPEIAAVLGRRDQLLFTPETAQQLREQGEAGLADVVEQAVRDGARPPDRPQQLYLLSTPDDERTITLAQPITHASSGPGSGFVRGQRYTSLAALKQQPHTTAELLRYQREN